MNLLLSMFLLLTLLLGHLITQSCATELNGISIQSGDIVMQGYLYVPSCQLSTMKITGNAIEPDGAGVRLVFTEMSGVRWAKAVKDEVMQEERINLIIKNCSLTQLSIELMADNLSNSTSVGNYMGLMTYLGEVTRPDIPGQPISPRQSEKNTASQEWLYYTVGLGDALINGNNLLYLPLKKTTTDMRCTNASYCVVKLDGSRYIYSNEWKQKQVQDTNQVWHGEWTPPESTLDELINQTKNGYLPSNVVSDSLLNIPINVRLHHGNSSADKDTVPIGDYQSKLTITVSIN